MTDAVYDRSDARLGAGYVLRRQPDPRIGAMISEALGDAHTVVNVGAGAGAYEPADRFVAAVEPSVTMIRQRPAGAAPCVRARAEALPFAAGAFDAAMAVLTLHHWTDWRQGLSELRRVARRRIVILTFDAGGSDFWLTRDYFPQIADVDRQIMPRLEDLQQVLAGFSSHPVPVPHDCIDGFLGAYWRRPEVYLDPIARRSISSFARIDATDGLSRLARDLASGDWAARHQDLLTRYALDVGYRLVQWDLDPHAA